MSKKIWFIVGGAVALIVIIAAFFALKPSSKATSNDLLTGEVTRSDIAKKITSTGVFQQPDSYNLTFKGQGMRIAKINVEVGDQVEKGKVLAEGDAAALKIQMAQAKAGLDAAKARLDQVKAGAQDAEIAAARAQVAGAEQNIVKAQSDYDMNKNDFTEAALKAAKATLASAQAALDTKKAAPNSYDLKSAQAAYDQALAGYNMATQNLSDAKIAAPVDGRVVAVNGKPGEMAGQAPVIVLETSGSEMEIVTSIDETDIGLIKVGQEAEINLDSYPGKKLAGEVVHIAPVAKTMSNVTYFDVTLSVPNDGGLLKTGMNANIAILVETRKNVLAAPSEAVKEDGSTKYVQLIKEGKADPEVVKVETGIDNGTLAEVNGTLQVGDKVVIGSKTAPKSSGFGPFDND